MSTNNILDKSIWLVDIDREYHDWEGFENQPSLESARKYIKERFPSAVVGEPDGYRKSTAEMESCDGKALLVEGWILNESGSDYADIWEIRVINTQL